jgi:hypothetical protein
MGNEKWKIKNVTRGAGLLATGEINSHNTQQHRKKKRDTASTRDLTQPGAHHIQPRR